MVRSIAAAEDAIDLVAGKFEPGNRITSIYA
jgi:hypothetical protein